ncbi:MULTISPECIES: MOSC domain-containing protein [Croceitalea]|uniref:MOSC domain-containing protein n=1 Tax=Croceitalea vernalis TaxID=3075599 RepID=A0ABU3BKW3_9FLAO|nr:MULTISPECIES: MOSC domain-containing protein [unclassified Croceitalea]MDT0540828.1 MOSC domain-containing protein [Croceitalea sp. P059]MDT0622807.1 MOSC domain-containing protein [Croceitalea sp. P007]
MKVIATNIGKATTVEWRGRNIETGIFKYPIEEPLLLKKEDVANDTVIDRKHHGGEFKACYLFSSDYYDDWKEKYPNLKWDWGMFGENLTITDLDENKLFIGDVYKLGEALVQITEPRQPCHKLGIRFENQKVIQEFIAYGHPGTYIKILEEGLVKVGDSMLLEKSSNNGLTVQQYNMLVNSREKDLDLVRLATENQGIRAKKREALKKLLS